MYQCQGLIIHNVLVLFSLMILNRKCMSEYCARFLWCAYPSQGETELCSVISLACWRERKLVVDNKEIYYYLKVNFNFIHRGARLVYFKPGVAGLVERGLTCLSSSKA